MKKGSTILSIICVLLFLLIINLGGTAYSAEVPSFQAGVSKGNAVIGDVVTVKVEGKNVTDLYAYDMLLDYPEDLLELQGSPKSGIDGTVYSKRRENGVQFGATRQVSTSVTAAKANIAEFTFKVLSAGANGKADIRIEWIKTYNMKLQMQTYKDSDIDQKLNISIVQSSKEGGGTSMKPENTDGVTVDAPTSSDGKGGAVAVIPEEGLVRGFRISDLVRITVPSVKNAIYYTVELPETVWASGNAGKTVSIETELAGCTFPVDWLDGIRTKSSDKVELRIEAMDRSTLGKSISVRIGLKPVVGFSFQVNGKRIPWTNPAWNAAVSIPYKPSAEELKNPDHIAVWYLDSKGEAIPVPNGRYDTETGKVRFDTNHFSSYAISYVNKTFQDIGGYPWAKEAIEALASKGVTGGIAEGRYGPGQSITRGDYITLLVRTLGLTAKVDNNFADVNKSAYYYEAAGIAKKLGIATGTGNNRFDPQGAISRQDMMVMTCKAMELAGIEMDPTDNAVLAQFNDRQEIAFYASASMAKLVKHGIIGGSDGKILPKGKTTRAQMAVVLYKISKLKQ